VRRPFAIFFLVIILLNTAGYYLVFEGWKWHNSLTWSFDEGVSNPELIVKIPFNVPYATDNEWEKGDGQFEYKGEVYRIVRQKLTLDAVYIALVKDQEGSRINEQQGDFAKTFSDTPAGTKQGTKVLPGFIKEYIHGKVSIEESVLGWFATTSPAVLLDSLVPSFHASIVHPPERA